MNVSDVAFNIFPNLETRNFFLREVNQEDCNDIYEIYSDKEAVRFQQIEPMQSIVQAKNSTMNFLKGYKNKQFIRWCIVDKIYDKVVGVISLHEFDYRKSKAEIGYMLNKKYWKQGIMSEVAERVIQYSFEVIELNKIEALINPKNIASSKFTLKLGFIEEDLKKGIAYNRLTAEFEDRRLYGLSNNLCNKK